MVRKGLTDTIDLVGHWGRKLKAVTHFCEVDKTLKSFKGLDAS